jgi:hypothetical protein
MAGTHYGDDTREAPVADTAALTRIVREIRLLEMLDGATKKAHDRFGADRLVVDRTIGPDSAEITAVFHAASGGHGGVDLWDLDPLLWDEANWAAIRYVPVGDVTEIRFRDVA